MSNLEGGVLQLITRLSAENKPTFAMNVASMFALTLPAARKVLKQLADSGKVCVDTRYGYWIAAKESVK